MTAKQGQDGMYYLNTPEAVSMTALPVMRTAKETISKEEFDILHRRLGHPSANRIKFSLDQGLFADMKPTSLKLDQMHHICTICDQAKMPRKRVKFFHEQEEYEVGECVHADIIIMPPSRQGYKNVLLMTDDRSKYFWVQILKTRAGLHTCIKRIINLIKTQHGTRVKRLRSDNEFITGAMSLLEGETGKSFVLLLRTKRTS
jgi:hypothetical protein